MTTEDRIGDRLRPWSRRRLAEPRAAVLVYVALALTALLLCILADGTLHAAAYLLASLLPVVAIPLGVRRFRPSDPRPWYLLAGGQVAFLVGDLAWYATGANETPVGSPSIADVAYLVGYPLLAAGLWLFIRARFPGHRLAPLVDAFAVGVAGAMLLWLVHIESFIHDPTTAGAEKLFRMGYPIGDVVLLGAVVYLLLAGRMTGPALRMIGVSLGFLLAADVLHSQTILGGLDSRLADTLWVLSYLAIGLAALLPSMRQLTEPDVVTEAAWPRRHWLVSGTALLVLPLSALTQQLVVGHVDILVILVAESTLAVLLLLSLHDGSSTAAQQERRYSTLLAKASDAFAVLSEEGLVTYISPASDRIAAAPTTHLVGRPVASFLELIHPEDREGAGGRLAAVLEVPGAEACERLRVMTAKGDTCWLEITARNLSDDADVRGVVLNYRDVTAETTARDELARRTDLLSSAEVIAGLGSWEWDGRTSSPRWSPGMWRLTGLDPARTRLDDETLFRAIHPDDVERVRDALTRSFDQAEPVDLGFRLVRPDGETRFIHAMGSVERDADGRPGRMRGTGIDVTERHETLERLRFQADILASVRESIIVTDLEGTITYWGNGAGRIFGYLPREVLGRNISLLYPQPSPSPQEQLERMLRGSDLEGEWPAVRKDGSSVWLDVHGSVLWGPDGEPAGFLSVTSDATELRASRAQLARLATAIEQSSESIVITDAEAHIEYVNPAFERVSGYSRAEVLGQNPRLLGSGEQDDAFYRAMWSALAAGRPWTGDITNRRKDGTLFQEQVTISPMREESGDVSGYVAVKRDVTEERRLEAEAMRHARQRALISQTIRGIDGEEDATAIAHAICRQLTSLSGIVNAGLFVFEADGRASPYGFSLVDGSLPPLRPVPSGRTRYLREQAGRGPWIEAWRPRRWHPYNKTFLEADVRAIAYAPVRAGGALLGFLHISSANEDAEDVLAASLPALVEVADLTGSLIGPRLAEHSELENARRGIATIIHGTAFSPVFQPIVDIATGAVAGYEGLTRFRDRVPPGVHFAEAERIGMGERLELATMEAALEAARDLPDDVWLNLNASPRLIVESAALARLLDGSGRDIVLEVTEHDAISDYGRFRDAVERLGPRVRLAVDDAGSGFASLRHILELRPALVKLDRSLIVGIESDTARRALVAGMQHFAGTSHMRLVAEGVETPAELAVLRELDVPLSQGFLLGRPAPAGSSSVVRETSLPTIRPPTLHASDGRGGRRGRHERLREPATPRG